MVHLKKERRFQDVWSNDSLNEGDEVVFFQELHKKPWREGLENVIIIQLNEYDAMLIPNPRKCCIELAQIAWNH